jgi:MSHA biogenesis protein MshK
MVGGMTRYLACLVGVLLAGAAAAQSASLADPTRPPSAMDPASSEVAAPAGPRLQSVLISPARRVAVIDGKTVGLGDKFGTGTLEAVTETAVVLKYADRRETLRLNPGVEKRERRAADAADRDRGTAR